MTQIGMALQAILGCAEQALSVPVSLSSLVPGGEVAWDDCCEGQLWIRVAGITPVVDPATARGVDPNCAIHGWQVQAAVGVVRCVTVLDSDGTPPDAETLTNETEQMLLDAEDVRGALLCCAADIGGIQRLSLGSWAPAGPLGGCAGGEWTFQFVLSNCVRCL